MKKILITGVNGFVGSHLAERLIATGGVELIGMHLDDNFTNIDSIKGSIDLVQCDLLDSDKVAEVVAKVRPDTIYHLAAQSVPAFSIADPAPTLRVNLFGTLSLLEAVKAHSPETVFVNIGSSEEYGSVTEAEVPIGEAQELRPSNPYAVSKVAQDMLGYQYWKRDGVKVVRCRPFNHFGPRQADLFVVSSFARQVAEIEAGLVDGNVMTVGNLFPERDFLDVRDVVSAYMLLSDRGEYGTVYNVCSGVPVSIKKILDRLIALSGAEVKVQSSAEKTRKEDASVVYGDVERLKALGWTRAHALDDSLGELLDYWRALSAPK
ncbi:MAG: GDP-mannose 4,6-dehydratase [Proteobacteria bacterium]|nr:GDP-mannose 4,6-dehydratase [Pseudomonadota bacterium]